MSPAQKQALHQMLNDLVHAAGVADASCANRERGSHAALCIYGAKHREILAYVESLLSEKAA